LFWWNLGYYPRGWGPKGVQLRYGCGWILWFMLDITTI
jgi:hypothetical protein